MTVAVATSGNGTAPAPTARPLPNLTQLKAVLFDIDGTLTDSDPLHLEAFREILLEEGFNGGAPIDEAFFRAHISGRHNPEIAADLFPGRTEEQRVAFYTEKERRFREIAASKLRRTPGLTEWMDWLRGRGVRFAAVTNAPRANAELMVSSLGLDDAFEALVIGEECIRAKPHPDPYLRAMELLGVGAGEALVVEDSPSGLRAAVAAGVPAVGLTTGQPRDVLAAAGACLLVDDFFGLLDASLAHERGKQAGGCGGDAAGVRASAARIPQEAVKVQS